MSMILGSGAVVLLLVPGILFLFSDLVLRIRGRFTGAMSSDSPAGGGQHPRFLVLVPAHDEEEVIGACVRSLTEMDYPDEAYRTVVVADNCTDRTAEVVRRRGVDCLERSDPDKRGKPYALAWAIERLSLAEWDYVAIVDADTRVASDFLSSLAEAGVVDPNTHFQAYYGLSNTKDSWLTRLSELLVQVRYEVLFPRKQRAGLNCPLTGNGMCFKTDIFQDGGWKFFSLTENWEAYARLTTAGERIAFVPEARIYSEETPSPAESSTRRQRWLAGRYGVFWRWLVPILLAARADFAQKLDAISELAYPGPVLHADAVIAATIVAWFSLPLPWVAAVVFLGILSLLPVVVPALSLARKTGDLIPVMKSLVYLPGYAVWRVGVALLTGVRSLTGMEWEKTTRKSPES